MDRRTKSIGGADEARCVLCKARWSAMTRHRDGGGRHTRHDGGRCREMSDLLRESAESNRRSHSIADWFAFYSRCNRSRPKIIIALSSPPRRLDYLPPFSTNQNAIMSFKWRILTNTIPSRNYNLQFMHYKKYRYTSKKTTPSLPLSKSLRRSSSTSSSSLLCAWKTLH